MVLRSLRWQLQVWHAVLLVVVLTGFGAMAWQLQRSSRLRDIDRDFHAYNDVYQEYFKVDPPARTTVEAKIYNHILVEIECVAYKPLA